MPGRHHLHRRHRRERRRRAPRAGRGLAPFGVKIDVEANKGRVKEPRIVSTPDSAVTLVVYPTNEELAIARQALTFA